jgi:hypothetical protein
MSHPPLPSSIQTYVTNFVARRRRFAVARAMGVAAIGFLAWMLIACTVDRFFQLNRPMRLIVLLCGMAVVALVIVRPLLHLMRRRFDWVAAAQDIEGRGASFSQRLVTVVSQQLGRPEHRGSDELLEQLSREVSEGVAQEDATRLVPAATVARPWLAVVLVAILTAGLCLIPSFGLPRLMARFFQPLAVVPAVTTTRLEIKPGKTDVVEGQPLTITAKVQRLGESSVTLHVSNDSQSWTTWPMPANRNGDYAYTLGSVDRDLSYYVTGGDATSLTYPVRVLHIPSVTEFRIHYQYPAYTGRSPLTVSNTDGLVEAPTGTQATIEARSTQPLAEATIALGTERLAMTQTPDPTVRQAKLAVNKDQPYELLMVARNGVHGSGPNTTAIRATADRPPLVRLVSPADDLRLSPHDILPLQYEALDDYGLSSLSAQVQMNSQPPWPMAIKLRGDVRHQAGFYNLDLALLKPSIGDVVSVWMQAKDTSGQLSISEVRHILISPRSIDMNTHQRIAELTTASQLAEALNTELNAAGQVLDQAVGQGDHLSEAYLAAVAGANRHVAVASETAVLLRQSLLRAIVHSAGSGQSVALADLVDSAQVCAGVTEDLIGAQPDRKNADRLDRAKLNETTNDSRRLVESLHTLSFAEQAGAVLADRENLAASEKQPAPKEKEAADRLKETRGRAQQDINEAATALKLNPQAGDLDAQLQRMIQAGTDLTRSQQPVDFVGASRQWAAKLGKVWKWPPLLDRRLSAAAQAEAVRPDADLIRANDLQLASRAAVKLSSDDAATLGALPDPHPRKAYPPAMEAMKREHDLYGRPNDVRPPKEIADIRKNAAKARELMRRWAGEETTAEAATTQPTAEDLAMAASAAAARHQYDQAQQLDQARQKATTLPATALPATNEKQDAAAQAQEAVKQAMKKAEALDQLQAEQEKLRQETEAAHANQAAALASKQNEVEKKIEDARKAQNEANAEPANADSPQPQWKDQEDPDYRDQEAAALSKAQEQLAAMPGQLSNVEQQFGEKQRSAEKVAGAERAAAAASADVKPAIERAAAAAKRELNDAQQHLDEAAKPVDPAKAEEMSGVLSKYTPQTDAAVGAVNDKLLPALRSLQQGTKANDAGAVSKAVADARRAIESAQEQLAEAQRQLMERDPLVAAKWYAKQASAALSRNPPDLAAARKSQKGASAALSRAWDQSIHQAAAERLAQLPSMLSLFALYPIQSEGAGAAAMTSMQVGPSAARDWGKLQAREPEGMNASVHEIDPPGFEDALKVYFEALGGKKK